MKPINTKERSKLFWQFFFIVFALCFLPLLIIFFAYYEAPAEIGSEQQEKLKNYSDFEHSQKMLVKQIADIDSNIRLLNNGSNADPTFLYRKIPDDIIGLQKNDTGSLMKVLAKNYQDYFTDAKTLHDAKAENKNLSEALQKKTEELKECKDDKKQLSNAAMPHS